MMDWDDAGGRSGIEGGIGAARSVAVEIYTVAYRVSGQVETRFSRVTEILNQLTGAHLPVTEALIREHAAPDATISARRALVSVEEILLMVAEDLGGSAEEMRIPKRPALAQMAMPPFRVTGRIHVPRGSQPANGMVTGGDRFIAMTEATIASAVHPELRRAVPVLAARRDRAHFILVAEDERPDELLAEVLDERTAENWLRSDELPQA